MTYFNIQSKGFKYMPVILKDCFSNREGGGKVGAEGGRGVGAERKGEVRGDLREGRGGGS